MTREEAIARLKVLTDYEYDEDLLTGIIMAL